LDISIPRLSTCFALGAALGTLLDGIHAYGDVLAYPGADFGRWAWFVPIEFGLLGVGAGLVMPILERAVGPGGQVFWSVAWRTGETLFFCGLYVLTTLADEDSAVALALALAALAGARLVWCSVPGDWAYVLAAALLGPAVEAALSALGVFEYLEPDLAGIPFWLPALWANGGFLIRRLIGPIVIPRPSGVRSSAKPKPTRGPRTGGDRS
jgi:hypothetical protein